MRKCRQMRVDKSSKKLPGGNEKDTGRKTFFFLMSGEIQVLFGH